MADPIATHVRQSPSGPIEDLPGGSGAVDSVFGRTGHVVAQPLDYAASQIANDSVEAGGPTVAAALDALVFMIEQLQSALAALTASQIGNDSAVPGANVNDALDSLLAQIGALLASQIGNDSLVNGGTGTVAAALNTLSSSIATVRFIPIVTESTTARTLALGDASSVIRCTNAAATAITVPANATVAFVIGTSMIIRQAAAGQVTLVAAGGVTLNTSETLKTRKLQASIALTKVGTNEWDVTGEREALP